MSVDSCSRAPRTLPPSVLERDVLQFPPPPVTVAKMRALCVSFGSASAYDRVRVFKMLRPCCARLRQARVESDEMSVAWSRGGESALAHVARAHALCQLFVRAHSFPGAE